MMLVDAVILEVFDQFVQSATDFRPTTTADAASEKAPGVERDGAFEGDGVRGGT